MKKFHTPYSLVILLLFQIIPILSINAQSNPAYSEEILKKIDQVEHNLAGWIQIKDAPLMWTLQERMKFYNANGVSIAVIKDYKIEWAKGYGWADITEKRPVTVNTLFQAGSNSKSLNAIGVLKLVQEKKLDLYVDINNYLKTWKFPYDSLSKGKKITTANLLSHTAGLTIHGFPGYEVGSPIPTLPQILDGIKPANTNAVRSQFEPGLKVLYSGGGTTISQLLIQDITGEKYDVYMKKNVLDPIGMTNSFYTQPPPPAMQAFLATGYYNDGKVVKGNYHVYPEEAAAGLWTTPTDLAKYVIETQLSLQGKSSKPLTAEMTKLRLTPYIDKNTAFGTFITDKNGNKYFTHGGVDEGFVSQYVGSLEGGNGVVVMTNTYNTALYDEIINSVANVYGWKDFYKPVIKTVVTVSDTILASYVGQYQMAPTFNLTVIKTGNQLQVEPTGQEIVKIYPESDTKFFLTIIDAQIDFLKDEKGVVTKLILHQNGKDFEGKKVK